MATVQEQLKLKRVPIDKWSTREQLCLSSSVLRSGDQNWMSVSRAVKVFGEPNRPDDWFSQKNCAVQYSTMLEKAETPKRKKRSGSSDKDGPVETAGEIILRKYTAERIEELNAILEAERAGYLKVQKELLQMESGEATAEQIAEWTSEMENEKKQKELDSQNHALWLRERERKKAQLERAWKPHLTPTSRRKLGIIPESPGSQLEAGKEADTSVGSFFNADVLSDDSTEPKVLSPAPAPASPFLTSLLKNPSPSKMPAPPTAPTSILHSAITSQRGSTPTITSLLSSSPGVPLATAAKPLPAAASASSDEMAAAGVPTLSMLLQIPPGGSEMMAAAAGGMDLYSGSAAGGFGSPALHHPQHQQLQLCKASDTDEILDVVDVEQSLVEDMEPIEIGLEEIIADLEQAANQDAAVALAEAAAAGAGGGKGQMMEDVPETPTNVDTFHKIFDDFYAMNVVKPKTETGGEAEEVEEVAGGEGPEAAMDGSLDDATRGAEEKQFVVSQFDVSREALNAELDSAVAYVEEREMEKSDSLTAHTEEVKIEMSTSDIFDSLLPTQPPIAASKVVEPEVNFGYGETSSGEVVDDKDKAAIPEDLDIAEMSTVLPEPEDSMVAAEVHLPEKVQETTEVTANSYASPEVTKTASVESEPVTTRQAGDRTKEKASPIKSVDDDHKVSKKPIKPLEKTEDKAAKKSKSKDKSDVGKAETSLKDVPSILKSELLKQPDKSEEIEAVTAVEEVEDTSAVTGKQEVVSEVPTDVVVVASEDAAKAEEAEIIPSEKSSPAARVEETDESTKDGDDKGADSVPDSAKAGELGDLGVAAGEVPSREKLSSSEAGTPKSEVNPIDFPSSSRRLIRRTGTPAMDSLPSSPASSMTEDEKEYRAWKKAIMLVWNGLAAHKYASIFCRPITDDIAPLYSIKIKRPIDLNVIKRYIETGAIRTTAEFQCHVMVMFLNACMYNKTKGDYFKSALEMQKDCLQQIQDFIATQKLIQSPGDNATTRRETRTTTDATSIGKRKRESESGKNPKKRKV